MEQLIHLTAAYSNAVLLVVLSNVSDFAEKLELPIPQPITISHVQGFKPHPFKARIGGALTLTNGYRFWMSGHGYVDLFYAPTNYYKIPDHWEPEDYQNATNFWGEITMTTNEVVEFARNTLRKLGYEPNVFHADGPPTGFSGPHKLWGKTVPYCEVEWIPKNADDVVRISINAEAKQVVGFALVSTNAWRPSPKLDVEPELESDYQKRMRPQMFLRTNVPSRRSNPALPSQPVPKSDD